MKKKIITIALAILMLGSATACKAYQNTSSKTSSVEITHSREDVSSTPAKTSKTTTTKKVISINSANDTESTQPTTTVAKTQSQKTTTTKKSNNTSTTKKTTTVPKTTMQKTTTVPKTTTIPTTTTTTAKEVTWSRASGYEASVLNEINRRRAEAGLEPFIACSSCKQHAAAQAEWNAAHLIYGQLSWHSAGQCGSESSSMNVVVNNWFESNAHRATMLSDYYTHAGVAVYQVNFPEGIRYCTIINFHVDGFGCYSSLDTNVPSSYLR